MEARTQNQSDHKYKSSQEHGEFWVKESELPQVAGRHFEPKF